MKILLVFQLAFYFIGIIFLIIAYQHRDLNVPFISFKGPIFGIKQAKLKFKTALGFHYAVIGGFLLGFGSLLGVIYWTPKAFFN